MIKTRCSVDVKGMVYQVLGVAMYLGVPCTDPVFKLLSWHCIKDFNRTTLKLITLVLTFPGKQKMGGQN